MLTQLFLCFDMVCHEDSFSPLHLPQNIYSVAVPKVTSACRTKWDKGHNQYVNILGIFVGLKSMSCTKSNI